jgi:Outer membrane protein beta-barrel domain
MLKKPLLAFLSLLCVLNLAAQKPFTPSTYLGITAGGAFNRVGFTPTVKQNMLAANSFGVIFRHISEPNIGVQIELNYAGRGWTENRDSLGNYTRNLTVLDIPFTAVFIIGSKNLRFAINLGPDVTYLLHNKEKISIIDAVYSPDYYRIVHGDKVYPEYGNPFYKGYYGKPMTQTWSFGFYGGASIEWYSRFGTFAIRASYCYMLTNYFPLNSDVFYYQESKSQTLNLGVSYFIKLF